MQNRSGLTPDRVDERNPLLAEKQTKTHTCKSKKALVFRLEPSYVWQGWRDSNSQHADLESAALPIGATPLLFVFNETTLE